MWCGQRFPQLRLTGSSFRTAPSVNKLAVMTSEPFINRDLRPRRSIRYADSTVIATFKPNTKVVERMAWVTPANWKMSEESARSTDTRQVHR